MRVHSSCKNLLISRKVDVDKIERIKLEAGFFLLELRKCYGKPGNLHLNLYAIQPALTRCYACSYVIYSFSPIPTRLTPLQVGKNMKTFILSVFNVACAL